MSVNILVRSLTASHFPHLPKQCDICHLDFLFSEAPLTTYTIWPYKLLLAMCPRQVLPNSIYKPQVTKAKSQSFTYKTQGDHCRVLDWNIGYTTPHSFTGPFSCRAKMHTANSIACPSATLKRPVKVC